MSVSDIARRALSDSRIRAILSNSVSRRTDRAYKSGENAFFKNFRDFHSISLADILSPSSDTLLRFIQFLLDVQRVKFGTVQQSSRQSAAASCSLVSRSTASPTRASR
jgi:hypothetical protein